MLTCQILWLFTTIDFDEKNDLFLLTLSFFLSFLFITSFFRWKTFLKIVTFNLFFDSLTKIWRIWKVSLRVSFIFVNCLYDVVFLSVILKWSINKQVKNFKYCKSWNMFLSKVSWNAFRCMSMCKLKLSQKKWEIFDDNNLDKCEAFSR